MSLQLTFADSEFNNKRRKILSRMNELMPWDQLETVIKPFILINPFMPDWNTTLF
jgi:IS5 family transposase